MTTAFFTFNGQDLGALYGLILEHQRVDLVPAPRRRAIYIPDRPGSHDFGTDLGEREITLECFVSQSTRTALDAAITNIAKALDPTNESGGDNGFKQLIFDTQSDRYYLARLADATQPVLATTTATMRLAFHCSDPFAYATSASAPQAGPGVNQLTFSAGGSYWVAPVVEVTAAGSFSGNLTITDSYANVLTWNGTLAASDVFKADASVMRTYKNGALSMSGLATASAFPRLVPGASNTLTIGGIAAGNITLIKCSYRARWL